MDNRYILFCSVMAQVRIMLKKGLITEAEYEKAERFLLQKYHLPPGTLFRDFRLLSAPVRGNMPD